MASLSVLVAVRSSHYSHSLVGKSLQQSLKSRVSTPSGSNATAAGAWEIHKTDLAISLPSIVFHFVKMNVSNEGLQAPRTCSALHLPHFTQYFVMQWGVREEGRVRHPEYGWMSARKAAATQITFL